MRLTRKQAILAWHILPADMRLQYGDNRRVIIGEPLGVRGPLSMCAHGLHASESLEDAIYWYAAANSMYPGVPYNFCRVEVYGTVLMADEFEGGPPKICGSRRVVLWKIKMPLPGSPYPPWNVETSAIATAVRAAAGTKGKKPL